MARGANSPPRPPALPQAVFTKVDIDPARKRKGATKQLQAFGYNDGNDWERPERYIRYHEPLESVLNQQVEYDMDEQDEEWLRLVNTDRKSQQLDSISYETFEIVMDRLEKEWFGLTKNIPQPDHAMPSEDSTCAICDDAEGENMNAIVFCDGCNLAVHQDCYGVPYIPEGQWLCRKCTVAPEDTVDCLLCPNEGGAFKQTQQGQWVHLLCALWVRETQVVNTTFMDPISGVDAIPRTRWKLRCSICKIHRGAPIQCAKTQCFTAFHVTCARRDKLLMPMKSSDGSDGTLEAFCDKHLPPGQRELHEAALASREAEDTGSGLRTTKAARAYAKTYTSGPPLVPALIVRRIVEYITSLSVRKKEAFVQLVARYWSLKREARRGAPLLKRLHLEPWTAIAGRAEVSLEDKKLKLDALQLLRKNLAAARELTDAVCSREAVKLQQAQIISDALSRTLYPFHAVLKMIVGKLMGHDKNGYFKHPVSKEVAPDYEERIKQPMWWQLIEDKLETHAYWDTASFSSDILLVVNNAMEYNKSDTPIYKAAVRIKNHAETHLAELAKFTTLHSLPEAPSVDQLFDAPAFTLGDLEPPQRIIDLLDSEELLTSELDIILDKAPAAALLAYEHANTKPPPPPPPRVKSRRPGKRDYVKERARAAEKRLLAEQDDAELQQVQAIAQELDAQEALDTSPGFRSRTTRRRAANANSAVVGPSSIAPAAPATGTPRGRTSIRKARQEAPPVVEHSAVPLLVEDVGNHQSFLSFNTGWILADGARRRRTTVTPSAETNTPIRVPPRKRQRLAPPAASVASAVASTSSKVHSATAPPSSRESSPLSDLSAGLSDEEGAMEVDQVQGTAPSELALKELLEETAPDVIPALVAEPMDEGSPSRDAATEDIQPSTIVVEEEPSIGSSVVSETDEALELVDLVEAETDILIGPPVIPEMVEVPPLVDHVEADMDTTSKRAIIVEVIDTPETRRAQAMARKKAKLEAKAADGIIQDTASGQNFTPGDLVWAKTGSFPWWPAVVREYSVGDKSIPVSIHKKMNDNNAKPKDKRPHLLVVFYYQENNFDCLSSKQLKSLGDDADADETVLKKNKYKSSSMKSRCYAAYQDALKAMLSSSQGTNEAEHDNAVVVEE